MEFYYHELDKSVLILSADGGLNADTSTDFVKQLEDLVDFGVKQMIVDCTNLTYISSYGIGVLVRLHNKLKKHGGHVKIALPARRRAPGPGDGPAGKSFRDLPGRQPRAPRLPRD